MVKDIKAKTKTSAPSTIGELIEILKTYDSKSKLSIAHVKMMKSKLWEVEILFSDVKLYADTEDEAIEEIERCIENSELFPQSVFVIENIEEQEDRIARS